MPRDRTIIGDCPKCRGHNLACSYNHFQRDDLVIDSWEHRCTDCGFRETRAFRSDEKDADSPADPRVCPYCGRSTS